MGLVRKTTVNFNVSNFHDYEQIYQQIFLKPGALLFVDFGWSSLNIPLYDPHDLIKKNKQIKKNLLWQLIRAIV